MLAVSMESGLEGRNNRFASFTNVPEMLRLNGVRPRRPEQSHPMRPEIDEDIPRLNGVRPRRPEQFDG